MRKRNAGRRVLISILGVCLSVGFAGAADVAKLADELHAPVLTVRREAAFQLEQMGKEAKAAVPALIKALEDSDHQVWARSRFSGSRPAAELDARDLRVVAHGRDGRSAVDRSIEIG
jgi:hypothetical protein